MTKPLPPGSERAGPFGRFEPRTESEYVQWALRRGWPAVRVVIWASVVVWAVFPFFIRPLLDLSGALPIKVWIIAWVVNVPVLAAVGVLGERYPRTWMAPVVLTMIMLDTLLCVLWVEPMTPSLVAVSGTLYYLFFIPVLQIAFRGAGAVLLLSVPTTAAVAILNADRDGTWNGTLNFQLWLLGAASFFALAISLVIENSSRGRFVDERVIARQKDELAKSRAMIRRYAPPAVADRIEHGDTTVDSAQRRRVTVFFADVVGFTALADRLDPEALAEIVNEYLGSVAQIIERHGGTLNEFAGDGIMAIFGAPDEMEPGDQVTSALRAAQELQRSLPDWSQRWYPLGIDRDLRARIGINTGVVSVGTFGSAVRATYTGIGLQTNIAARIQAQCDPGSVLLSLTSWHLVKDSVACEPRGEVEVKGVHFPIAMYEPSAQAEPSK